MTERAHIVFTAGMGWTGFVTRFATWGTAGHVAFELPDGRYLDATPSLGVAVHEGLAGEIVGRFTVSCEPDVEAHALAWAHLQAEEHKVYDWTALIGMAVRRDWHNPSAWFCSEIVAQAFEYAGFPLLRADHLNRVTPRDLMMSPCLRPA